MTDFSLLFGLLGLFYLLEGVWWAPAEAVAYSRGLWGRFSAAAPIPLRRDDGNGWMVPRHLIASGERFVTGAWPICLSPRGLCRPATDPDPDPAGRETRDGDGYLSFDAIDPDAVSSSGARFLYGGRTYARTASAGEARELAKLVRKLSGTKPRRRAKTIVAAIDRALDEAEAGRRASRLRASLRPVRWLPAALFCNLFLLAPALLALAGSTLWPVAVGSHAALTAFAVVVFLRVDRSIHPERDDRLAPTLTLLLFPPATARYAELLSRDLMAGLYPIAVAAALDRPTLERLGRALVAASRGREGTGALPVDDDGVETWFRRTFDARALEALERWGLHRTTLDEPPRPEAGAAAYCPRCGAQYRSGGRDCVDCEGVALVSLGTSRHPS